jgi:hypothetical protein
VGFFDKLFGKEQSGPGWVRGSARVISSSAPPPHATWGNVSANLVVEIPGMAAYQADYSKLTCPVSKWPFPGSLLPVAVDPRDTRNVVVLWDEVPTGAEAGRAQAARIVEHLNQGVTPPPGTSPTAAPPGGATSGGNDALSQIMRMFPGAQVHVSGSGGVSGAPAGMPPEMLTPNASVYATQSNRDPVERLEKLGKLRDAGIVDEAQFQQLRAQILEQAGLDD